MIKRLIIHTLKELFGMDLEKNNYLQDYFFTLLIFIDNNTKYETVSHRNLQYLIHNNKDLLSARTLYITGMSIKSIKEIIGLDKVKDLIALGLSGNKNEP